MGILYTSGAKVLQKGTDGAGHRTVTFQLHEAEMKFHFPSSPVCRTRANCVARLRRIIREIPVLTPPPTASITTDAPPAANNDMIAAPPVPAPTPPKANRLTAARRREIAKRYVVLRDFDKLLDETDIARHKLHILLNSAGGDPQLLYRRDLNAKRSTAPKQPKKARTMVKAPPVITPSLPELPPIKRGAFADNFRRHILITRMVYIDKVPIADVAKHAGVSAARIAQIAKDNYPNRNWKFD